MIKTLKYLLPLLFVIFLVTPSHAVVQFVPFNDLTGGSAGDLDNIECEDASGDDDTTSDALSDGDVAIGVVHTGGTAGQLYFYTYDAENNNTTNPEDSPYVVEPNDVDDDCSDAGAWILVQQLYMDRSTEPRVIFRDADATDKDQNAKIVVNCTTTTTGSEDCDIYFCAQEAGADISADPCATYKIFIDADGNIEVADDMDLATGKQYKINNVQIGSSNLKSGGMATASKSANYTVGTDDANECYGGVIYVTSTCDVTACDDLAAGMAFSVVTIGATQVDVDVQADDKMVLDGTTLDDGDKAVNTSTTGDIIVCVYYSADGWYCASGSNDGDPWTDGG